MTDTTTPSGGGSACLGSACTGQVTAKFVWTPTVNEVLPDEVYILQYASATWGKTTLGPPPMGMMSPSVQELSYSPRHRARVHRIQTAPGGNNPTANNGLGDAQVVVTQGQTTTGTSKGFKVVKVSPTTSNGQTYVEVGPVTVGVTGMGTAPISPGWGYSAQIMTPKMSHGTGGDITQPGTAGADVMVGEQNTVSVGLGISAVGTETPSISYQWSGLDNAIKGYKVTAATATTPNTGVKEELAATDLDDSQVTFYWTNGTFGGTSQSLTCVVTVDGTPITISGKCKIYRTRLLPTVPTKPDVFTGTYTTANPAVQVKDGEIRLGSDTSPGMTWNVKFETPNVSVAAGYIGFQQMTTFSYRVQGARTVNAQSVPYDEEWKGTDVLDSPDNDPLYENTMVAIPAASTIEYGDNDMPKITPTSTDRAIQASGNFRNYFMYKPGSANAIWVTLGQLNWSFDYSASRPDPITPWTITVNSPLATTPNPAGVDTADLPSWDAKSSDTTYAPVPPTP